MSNIVESSNEFESALYRFFDPSMRTPEDPYAAYSKFREVGPIFKAPVPEEPWILSHYDSVLEALKDKRLGHNPEQSEGASGCPVKHAETTFSKMQEHWAFQKDPPDHTRIRGVLNRALSPKLIRSLEAHVKKISSDLIDECVEKGEFDLISDLASPLPIKMIAELLGVPDSDSEQFFEWTIDLARTLDPNFSDPSYIQKANAAAEGLTDYFKSHISKRRKSDREDVLSYLIKAQQEGEIKSEEELISTSVMLFVAGSETTMNLIGNGMLALLKNPEELAKLKKIPSLIGSTIEELLRYDSSSQLTIRRALEDINLYGQEVKQGEMLLLLLGSANRDPNRFKDPDTLNISREDNRHLSFGYGLHFCLGAPLARLEARIAIPMLLKRMPNLSLLNQVEKWRSYITLRGLEELKLKG